MAQLHNQTKPWPVFVCHARRLTSRSLKQANRPADRPIEQHDFHRQPSHPPPFADVCASSFSSSSCQFLARARSLVTYYHLLRPLHPTPSPFSFSPLLLVWHYVVINSILKRQNKLN